MIEPESMVSVAKDHPGWVILATLDQSQSYEVDVTEIWKSPDGRIQLVTASGCSCWSGEYDIEGDGFTSVDALEKFLTSEDTSSGFNPSVKAREQLLAEARQALIAIRPAGASDEDIAAAEKLLGRNPEGWN